MRGGAPVERRHLTESDAFAKPPERIFLACANTAPTLADMRQMSLTNLSDHLLASAPSVLHAHFSIGDVVQHRMFGFRGVVFDIDPVFANTDEWYEAIPEEMRPAKEQPFYHLLAENSDGSYIAYVSQQNLIADESDEPVDHPAISGLFGTYRGGKYDLQPRYRH